MKSPLVWLLAFSCAFPAAILSAQCTLDNTLRRRIDRIIGIFEQGSPTIEYSSIENLRDGRGYTCGRSGFTTANGDLYSVIRTYRRLRPRNPFNAFLPELRSLARRGSDEVDHLDGFVATFKNASKDALFRRAQDSITNTLYFNPAFEIYQERGFTGSQALLILYDTIIQHGGGDDPDSLMAILTSTDMAVTAMSSLTEADYFEEFLNQRQKILLHAHDPETRIVWRRSASRVDTLRAILRMDMDALCGPISITHEGDIYLVP